MRKFTIHLLLVVGGLFIAQSCAEDAAEIPQYLDLVTEVKTLDFNEVFTDTSSIRSYRLAANKLKGNVNISSTAPFFISKSSTSDFGNSLIFTPDEFDAGPVTVYVKYDPEEQGAVTGQIVHSTEGFNTNPKVEVTGIGIQDLSQIPNLLMVEHFDYSPGLLPSTDRTADGTVNATMEDWIKVRTANDGISVINQGLTFEGYTGSGVGNAVMLDFDPPGSNSDVYAYNLAEQQDDQFVGSYYASVMIRVDGYPAEGQFNRPVMFIDWLPNGPTDFMSAIQVNNTAGVVTFGIKDGPGNGLTTITPEIGKTYIAVLKHTVTDTDATNSNNTVSLFILDAEIPATEPLVPDATMVTAIGDAKRVEAITLVEHNSDPGMYVVDGLKVAHTWEDLFK